MTNSPSLDIVAVFRNHGQNLARTLAALSAQGYPWRKDRLRKDLIAAGALDPDARRKDGSPVTKPPHLSTSVETSSQTRDVALDKDAAMRELITGNPLSIFDVCERLDAGPGSVRQWLAELNGSVQTDGERYWIEKPKVEIDKSKIITLLRKSPLTIEEVAAKVGAQAQDVQQTCAELKSEGVNLHTFGDRLSIETAPSFAAPFTDDRYQLRADKNGYFKFGVTSDNHLCSKYHRKDVLDALYDRFEAEGITHVYNAGNWIDGEARFNKFDLLVHGMNQQVEYFLDHYPQRKGITTLYVAGDDHEGWYCQREGVDIGLYTEMKAIKGGRNDLRYLGYMESYIDLIAPNGNLSKLLVCHPGGGSSYAISYTSQKSVEAYDGGEKPAMALYGHYHKLHYAYIRNVHTIQTGCTEDQTPFMRKKKLSAHIGGVIVEGWLDEKGAVTRCRPEFMTFFDRGYYQNQWNMSGNVVQHRVR